MQIARTNVSLPFHPFRGLATRADLIGTTVPLSFAWKVRGREGQSLDYCNEGSRRSKLAVVRRAIVAALSADEISASKDERNLD